MDELEVEEGDRSNPAIDGSILLDVGILEHATNKLSIHLNDEVRYADDVKAKGTERTKQACFL